MARESDKTGPPEKPGKDARRAEEFLGQPEDSPEAASPQAGAQRKPTGSDLPAAGPHAHPSLTNPDATPGAGTLPESGSGDDADSGSG